MIHIPFIKIWMTRGGGMEWVVALDRWFELWWRRLNEAIGRRTGPFSFFHHMCFSIVMGKNFFLSRRNNEEEKMKLNRLRDYTL